MMFQIPTFSLQFSPGMAAGSVLLSAAVIGIATWESCHASLKEKDRRPPAAPRPRGGQAHPP